MIIDEQVLEYVCIAAKRARERAGLTQRALAAELGWAQPRVAELESGKGSWTVLKAYRWALACGVAVADLCPP